jgi:hypothetical protein
MTNPHVPEPFRQILTDFARIPLVHPDLLRQCEHGVRRLDCFRCQAGIYKVSA